MLLVKYTNNIILNKVYPEFHVLNVVFLSTTD